MFYILPDFLNFLVLTLPLWYENFRHYVEYRKARAVEGKVRYNCYFQYCFQPTYPIGQRELNKMWFVQIVWAVVMFIPLDWVFVRS